MPFAQFSTPSASKPNQSNESLLAFGPPASWKFVVARLAGRHTDSGLNLAIDEDDLSQAAEKGMPDESC